MSDDYTLREELSDLLLGALEAPTKDARREYVRGFLTVLLERRVADAVDKPDRVRPDYDDAVVASIYDGTVSIPDLSSGNASIRMGPPGAQQPASETEYTPDPADQVANVLTVAEAERKAAMQQPASEAHGVSDATLRWLHDMARFAAGARRGERRHMGMTPADAAAILRKLGEQP